MKTSDIIELLDYALKTHNPIIIIPAILFIVFLLFSFVRKYIPNDYAAKEIKDVYEVLKQDYERLQKNNDDLEIEAKQLKQEIEKLKSFIKQNKLIKK